MKKLLAMVALVAGFMSMSGVEAIRITNHTNSLAYFSCNTQSGGFLAMLTVPAGQTIELPQGVTSISPAIGHPPSVGYPSIFRDDSVPAASFGQGASYQNTGTDRLWFVMNPSKDQLYIRTINGKSILTPN